MRGHPTKKEQKMSLKRKTVIIASVVVGILLIAAISAYALFNHYAGLLAYQPVESDNTILGEIEPDDAMTEESDSPQDDVDVLEGEILANLEDNATELAYNENVFNVLLIGSDTRSESSRGRSDTMIVISINKETQQIVMTSLLRDIYLNIPGVGNDRINAAYAYGGPALLIETIETNFGIDIDRYMQIDFSAFQKIIDTIGGVVIKLTDAEIEYINSKMDEDNQLSSPDNTLKLNGKQALQYARIRYLDSDFGRTERQRNLLEALFKQVKALSVVELNTFLNTLLPEVTTDLMQGELFSMVLSSVSYMKYDLVSFRIPVDESWRDLTINGMMVLGIDFAENRKALSTTIYGE